MLPADPVPLVLTGMTLRGVGSYLHGARLDIKPLTVLCGKNGSGKSTWLRVLNLLQTSLESNRLPFGFHITDWEPQNIQLTNVLYHLGSVETHAALSDAEADRAFGPPGTIGLEFQCRDDGNLSSWCAALSRNQPTMLVLDRSGRGPGESYDQVFGEQHEQGSEGAVSRAPLLLWNGRCLAGSRFRLRICHPSYWADSESTVELHHLVELHSDHNFVLRMWGERDPLQKFEDGHSRPRRSKPYELWCSRAFLPGGNPIDTSVCQVAEVLDLLDRRCEPCADGISQEDAAEMVSLFEERIRQLTTVLLHGCYLIGAVRQPHFHLSAGGEGTLNRNTIAKRRYVGSGGEHAWLLERHYAESPMRPIRQQAFTPTQLNGRSCLALFAETNREKDRRLRRIWESASSQTQCKVEAINCDSVSESIAASVMADLLNESLRNRDLFSFNTWSWTVQHDLSDGAFDEEREWGEEDVVEETLLPKLPIEHSLWRGVSELDKEALEHVNYLLIESTLSELQSRSEAILKWTTAHKFEEYVSWWLHHLTDTCIASKSTDQIKPWNAIVTAHLDRLLKPNGFLVDYLPYYCGYGENDKVRLERLIHPCFGKGPLGALQPPRQLSSGFHQVLPIVVQAGLMKYGETLGIENPEVHLHPSLQLAITEMLIEHAASGRRIIVETHSDLVIRRVVRAILEERLSQADLQIYFSDLEDIPVRIRGSELIFQSSRLNRVHVDENGRIDNWPPGFLDDDIAESQRLLDIMYGGSIEGDEGVE